MTSEMIACKLESKLTFLSHVVDYITENKVKAWIFCCCHYGILVSFCISMTRRSDKNNFRGEKVFGGLIGSEFSVHRQLAPLLLA